MVIYNSFKDVENGYISFNSSDVLDLRENSFIDREYDLDGGSQNLSLEIDPIYKNIFENYKIDHKENYETSKQKNKIYFNKEKDISLLNKKRYRNAESENSNSENIQENSEDNEETNINSNSDSKDKSMNKNLKHNKYCKDNIFNKLKGYFLNHFVIDIVEKNSEKKDIKLKILPNKTFIADLNKKKNEQLFKMKMADIFRQEKISSKYSKHDHYYNKNLIDKIYEEKKERNVIKILELTFEELFIIFRRKLNDSEDLKKLEKIKNKIKGLDLLENDNYKDIQYFIDKVIKKKYHERDEQDEYIKKFKSLCLTYQNWFNERKGRASRKKMSNYL